MQNRLHLQAVFFVWSDNLKKGMHTTLDKQVDGCILKIPPWGIRTQRGACDGGEKSLSLLLSENHKAQCGTEKKALLNRLRRIEGQVRGIQTMLEQDAYCNDVLIQSAAVNAAMNAFNRELLASHIRGCVVRDIRAGQDEVIDELVATLQKLMK